RLPFIQSDVSPNTPVYVSVRDAQIGLRELTHDQQPASYLDLLKLRLNDLAHVHVLSSDEVPLIQLAMDSLKSMVTCLDHVYQDAKQLVPLTFDQLLRPSSRSILNDMFIQALCAFGSQPDPLHLDLTAVGGISTVFDVVQLLAAFRNLSLISSGSSGN